MNAIINAGDTLGAAVKIGLALGVVYAGYRIYQFGKDVEQSTEEFFTVEENTKYFVTNTINPGSYNNFINDSIVGDVLGKPVDAVINFFRD